MASDADTKSKKKQAKKASGDDEEGDGSRSNHQRLQAVDLFSYLIKDAFASEAAREQLHKHLELVATVIIKVIENSESWKNKKVKKTA